MRLVVIVNYTDDCTYNYNETVPVVYESPEAFLVDFEKAAIELKAKWPSTIFFLGGKDWDAMDFFRGNRFDAPDILTIDEWFGTNE
jgi:hypothetical protein